LTQLLRAQNTFLYGIQGVITTDHNSSASDI